MLRNHSAYVQLFALLMLTASGVGAGEPAGKNWHRDWNSAWKASQAQDRPILLFVTMENCHYCDRMCQNTYGNKQVLQDLERGYVLASIDSDRNPNLVRRLNVRLFPTTLIIGRDNKVIDSMPGYVGPEQLRSRLKTAETRLAARS
jgi:protein disulfide-isomerase